MRFSQLRGRLGRRLFLATLIFSFSLILIASGLRAFSNFAKTERELDQALQRGIQAYAGPIAEALWVFDDTLVSAQVEAIANLDFVAWAAVSTDRGIVAEAGALPGGKIKERSAPLWRRFKGNLLELGELRVVGDESSLLAAFYLSLARDIPLLGLIVVLVSAFLLVLVDRSVSRRIVAAKEHFAGFDLALPRAGLEARPRPSADEIDELVEAFNRLEGRFRDSWNEVAAAKARAESSEAALQASLREKNVLIAELFHRTRNSLQVTLGLIQLEKRAPSFHSLPAVLDRLETRIHAMALVHRGLQEKDDLARLRLDDFVRDFAPFARRGEVGGGAANLSLELEEIVAALDVATPFGIALGELLADLAPGSPARVRLFAGRDGRVELEVEGRALSGGGPGLEIATALIEDQLGGEMAVTAGETGLQLVRSSFPNPGS